MLMVISPLIKGRNADRVQRFVERLDQGEGALALAANPARSAGVNVMQVELKIGRFPGFWLERTTDLALTELKRVLC